MMDKVLAAVAILGTALAAVFGAYAFVVWVFAKIAEDRE